MNIGAGRATGVDVKSEHAVAVQERHDRQVLAGPVAQDALEHRTAASADRSADGEAVLHARLADGGIIEESDLVEPPDVTGKVGGVLHVGGGVLAQGVVLALGQALLCEDGGVAPLPEPLAEVGEHLERVLREGELRVLEGEAPEPEALAGVERARAARALGAVGAIDILFHRAPLRTQLPLGASPAVRLSHAVAMVEEIPDAGFLDVGPGGRAANVGCTLLGDLAVPELAQLGAHLRRMLCRASGRDCEGDAHLAVRA